MNKILNHLKSDWYKYVLELIVITAGILGAFLLNNWNEDRKNAKIERAILSNINAEFRQNRIQFERNQKVHQQVLDDCRTLEAMFPLTPANIDTAISFYKNSTINNGFTFNPSQSSLESMISSSSFDLINNPTLKNYLISWKDMFEDYSEEEYKVVRFVFDQLLPFRNKHLPIYRDELHLSDAQIREFENLIGARLRLQVFIIESPLQEDQIVIQAMDSIIALTDSYRED